MENENDLLTVSEVAKLCRVDVTTVRRWIDNNLLPAISLPRTGKYQNRRVRKSDIKQLMNAAK